MKKKLLKKLRSQRGESIGETLISVLIASLALLMLAGAISAASNIINGSKTAMNDYYDTGEAAIASQAKTAMQGEIVPYTTTTPVVPAG